MQCGHAEMRGVCRDDGSGSCAAQWGAEACGCSLSWVVFVTPRLVQCLQVYTAPDLPRGWNRMKASTDLSAYLSTGFILKWLACCAARKEGKEGRDDWSSLLAGERVRVGGRW